MVVCRHKHALYDDTDILITLFRHVENAKEVKHAAMQGLLEASVIKASMVVKKCILFMCYFLLKAHSPRQSPREGFPHFFRVQPCRLKQCDKVSFSWT